MKLIMENWRKYINESIKFRNPNFDFEWDEARIHHSENFPTKEVWLELSSKGRMVDALPIAGQINNTQFTDTCKEMEEEYQNLTPDRRERVSKIFDSGEIELPIVKKVNGEYTLIAGNTRLTMMGMQHCRDVNYPVEVWLIDLDNIE